MAIFNVIPNVGIKETWEWKTDVLTTINGTESRLSLRDRPRINLGADFNPLTDEERRNQWFTIFENIKSVFATPVWPYSTKLTQFSANGTSKAFFDPTQIPLVDGELIILIKPTTGQAQSHFITTVDGTGANLATALTSDIDSSWVAVPGFLAKIEASKFSLQALENRLRVGFKGMVDTPIQSSSSVAGPLDTLSDGNVVLNRTFITSEEDIDYPREGLDYGGARAFFSQWQHARVKGPRRFITQRVLDPTDFDYWRLFFDTVKGNWKAFYISTQKPDVTLAAPLVANASSFQVNEDVFDEISFYSGFSQFEIKYADKTSSFHNLTSVGGNGGPGPYTYNIEPNLPNDAKVANVERVSYLLKARMSDTVQLDHGAMSTVISFDITGTDFG